MRGIRKKKGRRRTQIPIMRREKNERYNWKGATFDTAARESRNRQSKRKIEGGVITR